MSTQMAAVLMLPLMFVTSIAQWTSEDESEKIAADNQSLTATIPELQGMWDVDLRLKNQTHILNIAKRTLAKENTTLGRILADVDNAAKVLKQDEKIRLGKEAALRNATATASLASVDVEKARQALEDAERTAAGKTTDKQNAKATALTEALARSKSVEAARREAQNATAAADARVKSDAVALEKKREQAGPILLGSEMLKQTVERQTSVVESLSSKSASLHKKLAAAQKGYEELQKTLEEDIGCRDRLQEADGLVQHATTFYNVTIAAYQLAPDDQHLVDAAWESIDKLENATYQKYLIQKACAPKGVGIPPKSPPTPCETDTGGTCHFIWCWESRGAQCDRDTSRCVCTVSACAKDGACHSRGPPNTDLAKSTALGQEASPDAGSLDLLLMVIAALAAVAAAVVHNRRVSRRVVLPPFSLG